MNTPEEDVRVTFNNITERVKSYDTFKKVYNLSAGNYSISFTNSDNELISPILNNLALYAVTNSKYSQLQQTTNGLTSTVSDMDGRIP